MDWQEFWLPIDEYPNYEVSNYGEVRNKTTDSILKGEISTRGYNRIQLINKNGRRKFSAHRLTLRAFSVNTSNLPEINHINGVKAINIVTNLEWCTSQQNQIHAVSLGLITASQMGKDRIPVDRLSPQGIFTERYGSLKEAAAHNKCHAPNIRKCLDGKRKTCAGYMWRLSNIATPSSP